MTSSSIPAPCIGQSVLPVSVRLAQRYRVIGELARGGNGAVVRVVDERTGTECALKRPHSPVTADVRAQFEREYRTLSGLRHPGIIEVYDYGVDAGEPHYTMELLDGQDLRDLSPLPFEAACRYLRDIASSLALLHTRRLLHRDIKPANIRVTTDGRCKLLDFGALTPFGTPERVVGTPPFVPPEALSRSPLDQRADLYAFGALWYWLLTRRHAYRAREFDELPALWKVKPLPPSHHVPDIPAAVDRMILSLLDPDPMARPNSMAEVVELLNLAGHLPPQDRATQRLLGESYLATPPLIGRAEELASLDATLERVASGHGAAVWVEGTPGAGRSRLLDELDMHARLSDVLTVHVDAAMHVRPRGTAIAIAAHLIEESTAARAAAEPLRAVLSPLDPSIEAALGRAAEPGVRVTSEARAALFQVLHAAVTDRPVMLLVDNADHVDEASLSLLQSAARTVERRPLGLVVCVRLGAIDDPDWAALRDRMRVLPVEGLSAEDMLSLVRSLFGPVDHLVRLARWLDAHSGGLPLHALGLIRRLYADGDIEFRDGAWRLPGELPDAGIPQSLEHLIDRQLYGLSPEARALSEAIAIRRGRLARSEAGRASILSGADRYRVVEELLQHHVLVETRDGYAFRNHGVREGVHRRMAEARRRELHVQCAEEVLREAAVEGLDHAARIEAGTHLLAAGEDSRGADLLAAVAHDSLGIRLAQADLQVVAPALEKALAVYERQGRSLHERAPLLGALAQAGYYEHRRWGERYGDAALAVSVEVTGLVRAPRLQRIFGKTLGLVLALSSGWLEHVLWHRPPYSFRALLVQLMGTVTTLAGVAAMALDVERARRVASVLDPFKHLPERLTPVGIWQVCSALCEIGRDNPAAAMRMWEKLRERFQNPRYYPTLPPGARPLYMGGLWFASGVFEAFRNRGGALRAADELDRLGPPVYRLIASELRVLHHLCRGDLDRAREHADQMELQAVEIGSASQVELWDPAARILPYLSMGELTGMRSSAQRLRAFCAEVPTLTRYAELAELAVDCISFLRLSREGDVVSQQVFDRATSAALAHFEQAQPRAFIGWGVVASGLARLLNQTGAHAARAQRLCERVLSVIDDEDREYVAMFLGCELELAVAEASLGEVERAEQRLAAVERRHGQSDNPLTRGLIHDACCRVAASAGRWGQYRVHLAAAREHYRSTNSSGLAARTEVLAALERRGSAPAPTGPLNTADAAMRQGRPDERHDGEPDEATLVEVGRGGVQARKR